MKETATRTLRNVRREALFVLGVWLLALLWTLGYCSIYAYQPGKLELVFGLPSWVAWGIVAPAIACSIVTLLFGLLGMQDDPLEPT